MPKLSVGPSEPRDPRLTQLLDKLRRRDLTDDEYEALRRWSEHHIRGRGRGLSQDDIDDIFGESVVDFLEVAEPLPLNELDPEYRRALGRHRKRYQRSYKRTVTPGEEHLKIPASNPHDEAFGMDRTKVRQRIMAAVPRALESMNQRYRQLVIEAHGLEGDGEGSEPVSSAEAKARERALKQFGMRLEDVLVEERERSPKDADVLDAAIRVVREDLLEDLFDSED